METLPRQLRVRSRMLGIFPFGFALALLTVTAPHEARARATSPLTITKVIAPDDYGPWLRTAPTSLPMTITCRSMRPAGYFNQTEHPMTES
jgi:hypothetical protein